MGISCLPQFVILVQQKFYHALQLTLLLIIARCTIFINFHSLSSFFVDPETAKQLRGSEILKYGIPDRGPDARLYTNHVICYDQGRKIPVWVAELITKSDLKGKNCNHMCRVFVTCSIEQNRF